MRLADDSVIYRVPTTSANLGPGPDSMGLALDLWDEVSVCVTVGPTAVAVEGGSVRQADRGERNLVARMLRLSLDRLGTSQVGIRIHYHNRIPHSRGLGSSVAAIIAGFAPARALVDEEEVLGPKDVLDVGTELESRPDNVAPVIFDGATVARMEGGTADVLRPAPPVQISLVAFIPDFESVTKEAWSALPELIAHGDARYNISCAALLSALFSGAYGAPVRATLHELLMGVIGDRLHQERRRVTMESSLAPVDWLRVERTPAVVSGVGSTVLFLEKVSTSLKHDAEKAGWRVLSFPVAPQGAQITRRRFAGLCGVRAWIYTLFAFTPPSSRDLFCREVQILAQYFETGRALLHLGQRLPRIGRFTTLTRWRFFRCTLSSEAFHWGRLNEP